MSVINEYYYRDFLNVNKGSAFIEIEYQEQPATLHSNSFVNSYVNISDCNRKIELDFCIYSEKEKEERLVKLDKLINQFQQLRELVVKYEHQRKFSTKKPDETENTASLEEQIAAWNDE